MIILNGFILVKRELTEWFKVISLKLIWFSKATSVRIGYFLYIELYGLEPGWLGASFGLRISYVRIIITRKFKYRYIHIYVYVFISM